MKIEATEPPEGCSQLLTYFLAEEGVRGEEAMMLTPTTCSNISSTQCQE